MRIFLLAAGAVAVLSTAAMAEQPAQNGPQNPAVKSTDQNNASAPVAGANSYTRGEARSRIEAKGYTNVTHLRKDESGVWRATAQKDGKSTSVSVDYQGNVN
jgi:hypothetical protein